MSSCRCCHAQLVPRHRGARSRSHAGRGLCGACYFRALRNGALADYPRMRRTKAELLAEYAELRDRGYGRQEIPRLLGMTDGAVERALQRARADGDVRAT